jgi:hypothetical protein
VFLLLSSLLCLSLVEARFATVSESCGAT